LKNPDNDNDKNELKNKIKREDFKLGPIYGIKNLNPMIRLYRNPKKSRAKPKAKSVETIVFSSVEATTTSTIKRPGRPPGSKNKKKEGEEPKTTTKKRESKKKVSEMEKEKEDEQKAKEIIEDLDLSNLSNLAVEASIQNGTIPTPP
jgi:hypothetical protein